MGEQKNVLNVNIKKANKMKTEKNTFLEKYLKPPTFLIHPFPRHICVMIYAVEKQ